MIPEIRSHRTSKYLDTRDTLYLVGGAVSFPDLPISDERSQINRNNQISILFVDDEDDFLQVARRMLERSGAFRVEIQSSAQEALNSHRLQSYDAIVSDYQIPGMNGIEFLKVVRRQYGDIPFILLTGRSCEEVVIDAINNGADFYLQKRGNPETLFADMANKLRQAVRRKRAEDALRESETKLSTFFHNSPFALIVISADTGIFVDVNEVFLTNTGYCREEVIGKSSEALNLFPDRDAHNRMIREIQKHHTIQGFEISCRNKSGEIRTCQVSSTCIMVKNSSRILSTIVDITERKKAEIQVQNYLKGLEYLSRRAVEILDLDENSDLYSFIGSTIHDLAPPGSVVIINEADFGRKTITTQSITGITPVHQVLLGDFALSLMGRPYPISETSIGYVITEGIDEYTGGFRTLTGHTFPEEVYQKIEQSRILGKIYGAGLSWKKNIQGSVVLILPPDNELENRFQIEIFIQLAAIELQRRQFAHALREERSLFIAGPVVVFRWAPEEGGPVLYVSPNVMDQFGYNPDDLVGEATPYVSLIHPEDAKRFSYETIRHAEEGRRTFEIEYRLRRGDGQYRWVYDFTHIEQDETGLITSYHGYILDINERKNVERLLKESEENANALINANKESILLMRSDGIILYVNDTNAERMGYHVSEMIGNQASDFLPPEIREQRRQYVQEVLKSGKPFFALDERYGRIIENYLYPVFDERGEITRIAVYGRDITEQHETLKRIQESEERYRVLAESSGDVIFIQDLNGIISYVNLAGAAMISRSQEEIVGKSFFDLFPPSVAFKVKRLSSEVIATKKVNRAEMEISVQGELHWFDLQLLPLLTENGSLRAIMGSVRDITEQKQMEMSLREAIRKLKVLTGITRHDVMNDLSVISLSLDMVRESEDDSTRKKYIDRAFEAGKILEKTIDFTREYEDFGSISGQWFTLLPIINQAVMEVSLSNIEVEITVSPHVEVFTDPILRKVFTTLLDNSMRHGKIVSVIRISTEEQGNHLIITYKDDGVGIPEKEKELIFQHGFGKHTGIGLFLSREILSIMGMTIRECGTQGHGVRFEILVPKGTYRYQSSQISSPD